MELQAQHAERIVEQMRSFYQTGATKGLAFRLARLRDLRRAIARHEEELLSALRADLGKSEFEAYATEIGTVYESIQLAERSLGSWMERQPVPTPLVHQPSTSFIAREPFGVALIIGPFNYPCQLVLEPLIGAIAGGNCAVVKPSESTPHTARAVRRLLEETFDPRYIRVVEGEKETVTALLGAPFDFLFFTGSAAVGKVVMKAAAERLTPFVLELGGKSPAIVDQTANVRLAARRIAWGKWLNAGQTCVAPDYVAVHDSVHDAFVRELQIALRSFYGADAQQSPDYGRIVNGRQWQRLADFLRNTEGQIAYGGRLDRADLYAEPTVVTGVQWSDALMEEELFGPILPVLRYRDLPALIDRVRQLPKPLAAYFFSESERAIDFFLEELPFGGGCINDALTHVANSHLPFGGVGPSGIGSYHGRASFEAFTHAKSIVRKSTRVDNPLAFPPYRFKTALIRAILR